MVIGYFYIKYTKLTLQMLSHSSLFPKARKVCIPSCGTSITLTVLEAAPEAVTVLFYPGTMASPLMYPLLLNELHRLGCNVVGIHPLSHGLSPREKISFTFEDILQNGKDAQRFARQYFSGPIVVSGHSQGGILSLAHALHNPHIQGIFPITTLLPQRDEAGSVTRMRALLKYKSPLLRVMRFMASCLPFVPIPFLAYLELKPLLHKAHKVYAPSIHKRASYPLRFISSLFHVDLSAAEREGAISCPLMLLTAKDDQLFPLTLMQSTYDAIKAPRKKLIVIHGGGHLCAVSRLYAPHIAAHIAQSCAALGLPLHTLPHKKEISHAI